MYINYKGSAYLAFVSLLLVTSALFSTTSLQVNVPGDNNQTACGTFNVTTYQGDLRGCLNYLNILSQQPETQNFDISFALSSGNETIILKAPPPPKIPPVPPWATQFSIVRSFNVTVPWPTTNPG